MTQKSMTAEQAKQAIAAAENAVQSGNIDVAVADLEEVTRACPNSAEAHEALGTALLSKGEFPRAVACLRKALELAPSNMRSHNQLGFALAHTGDTEGAVQSFSKTLELAPNNVDALLSLIELYRGGRRYSEAMDYLERAVGAAPREPDVIAAMGTLSLEIGDQQTARQAFGQLQTLAPNHPIAQVLADALNN